VERVDRYRRFGFGRVQYLQERCAGDDTQRKLLVTGLSASTTYSFTVAAYDNAGNIPPRARRSARHSGTGHDGSTVPTG